MRRFVPLSVAVSASLLAWVQACSTTGDIASPDRPAPPGGPDATAGMDAGVDAPADVSHDVMVGDSAPPDASTANPCQLPGSLQYTSGGMVLVPGGDGHDLTWLRLPTGFCAHYFGNVGNARQIRFAPGGELFVASPTTSTTGGGANGKSAIFVLADDDKDGLADGNLTFLSSLPSTQGILFTAGYFYYQDNTRIMRVPYKSGDRVPSSASEQVADITIYTSGLHWPKALDQADDGTIYVGNGGDQTEQCDATRPFHGGILKIGDGSTGGTPVAKGLRNPINVRCAHGKNRCFAVELAKDYTGGEGGREKLLPIRAGDDWGFPCCATQGVPYSEPSPPPDCSAIAPDTNSFLIGDTPFGVDFEPNLWPGTFRGNAFIVTHGAAGTWAGARLVAIEMDPVTGMPKPSTNTGGANSGAMVDFGTGWVESTPRHGRPSALTFAADGRLFLANDQNGDILWIAPLR